MSGNIDTSNNIFNATGSSVPSPFSQQSVGNETIAGVRNSISNITTNVQANTQNNREDFSITSADDNTDRYSARSINSLRLPGSASVSTDYTARSVNSRRPSGSAPVSGDYTISNSMIGDFHQKNIGRTRIMTAKDSDFINLGRNQFTYSPGATPQEGQVISRQEAQDALFYGDIANAMIDNGFILTAQQRENISKFRHQFSPEFASFNTARADILYTQAAIVDALITNGATLTPDQERNLGITGGLTRP
jgi:hypothetical protein